MKKLKPLIVILGPTASGKTDLAIKLAKKFKGEIVSADSRQIYKGMDIGTAKIRNKEQKIRNKKIAQYLIDIIRPDRQFNVALYKKRAMSAIKAIIKRKKVPFLVGGTGLYIEAIVENINFPKIPANKKLRKNLEKKTAKELYKIYNKLDSVGVKHIDRNNKRRLIRAIEVCKATGSPFWDQRKKGKELFDVLQIGIKLPKKELQKRIKERVEKMIRTGLEKEVRGLVKKYGWAPPFQTIGYQEWKKYFEEKINKKEVEELIILHTLQFAKRQMTWFKRDRRIHWLKNYRKAERLLKHFLK